ALRHWLLVICCPLEMSRDPKRHWRQSGIGLLSGYNRGLIITKTQWRYKPRILMNNSLIIPLVISLLLMFRVPGTPAEAEDSKSPSRAQAKADLQVLVGKVQSKLAEGKKTEKDLAEEVKEFDTLLAKYKD